MAEESSPSMARSGSAAYLPRRMRRSARLRDAHAHTTDNQVDGDGPGRKPVDQQTTTTSRLQTHEIETA